VSFSGLLRQRGGVEGLKAPCRPCGFA
jgi:hypothetical protein